jgi:hypothetical protein
VTADVRPLHRERAARLIEEITLGGRSRDGAQETVARALAEAEAYGMRRAVNRIDPALAEAATVLADLTAEVAE